MRYCRRLRICLAPRLCLHLLSRTWGSPSAESALLSANLAFLQDIRQLLMMLRDPIVGQSKGCAHGSGQWYQSNIFQPPTSSSIIPVGQGSLTQVTPSSVRESLERETPTWTENNHQCYWFHRCLHCEDRRIWVKRHKN